MNKTRMSIVAATLCAGLLAGCSSGEAATSDEAAAPAASSDAVLGTVEGMDGMEREPSGITGEVAYASDGLAQVQDGSTQTAVSWTDDTEFTQQVEIALADIAEGACVVATLDDDGAASAISVTEADDDGECSLGFGGMGGRMGGGMPDGEMPDGAEMPTDLPSGGTELGEVPSDMPSGAPGDGEMPAGGFDGSSRVAGAVAAVTGDGLTVEGTDGEETDVAVADDVTITGTEAADADAVAVGMCLTAAGEADDAGGYAATTVAVFDAGDDGCVSASAFGGGRGGMQGGPGGAPGDTETGTSEPALESGE
ncbi:hypothetical protein QQX09_09740 [Demequina sp. SYSU T00192]|uniref:DUF5666 domain-containing protein n=1 Tax=Demequina litoralis TaxID=3051660 RepID=A0ABT8GAH7_9MICO|nr:hypothetical protein [Demequina sp. SYSU T00192]MDN4476133.1 hypothetical protein [Demequina sp. SYSU T00192]